MNSLAPSSVAAAPEKPSLIGLSRAALAEALRGIGVPESQLRMHASQIWHWLYFRGVTDFSTMTNIAKPLRDRLAEEFSLARPEIVAEQISVDGTRKWLLRFPPRGAGRPVEIETLHNGNPHTLSLVPGERAQRG